MAYAPTQLPSLRWQGAYRIGRKGQRVTRTFDTYGEAQDWAEQAEREARRATTSPLLAELAPPPSSVTITQHGATWLAGCGELAKSTRDGYAWSLRTIADSGLGAQPMAAVKRSDVKAWRTALLEAGTGRPSINAHHKVLRMVYLDALAEGLVVADPTHGLDYLKQASTDQPPLSKAQQAALLDAAPTATVRALILLGLDAGLRYSEAAGLRTSSVQGNYLRIHEVLERATGQQRPWTKSGRERVVPMTTRLREALAPLVLAAEPGGLVVTTERGAPLLYDNFRHRVWAPLTYRAGLVRPRPGFHQLRHTYGSTLAARGVPRSEIAELMGHADESTTKRYIHSGDDGRRLELVREALGA